MATTKRMAYRSRDAPHYFIMNAPVTVSDFQQRRSDSKNIGLRAGEICLLLRSMQRWHRPYRTYDVKCLPPLIFPSNMARYCKNNNEQIQKYLCRLKSYGSSLR